jgi:hypothetical protein
LVDIGRKNLFTSGEIGDRPRDPPDARGAPTGQLPEVGVVLPRGACRRREGREVLERARGYVSVASPWRAAEALALTFDRNRDAQRNVE